MQKLTLTHGKVLYIPDVFDKNLQDYYFNELSLLDWQTGGGIAYGKAYTLNRLIAGYDDNKFPEVIEVIEVIRNHIRNKVKEYTGEHHLFDNVFMNLYQSGKNHIPMHRDNYEGEEGPIASVSLGAARFFDFCSMDKKEKLRITLESGSLLIMDKSSQQYYKHGIPKQLKVKESRINLTFRTQIL